MGHNVGMQSAFGVVLFVVVVFGAVAAVISFFGSSKLYGQIGRGAMSLNENMEDPPKRSTDSRSAAVVSAERDDEVRQLLTARNERRSRRGETPLDVEAEVARQLADPAR